jgi:hypothetical protein
MVDAILILDKMPEGITISMKIMSQFDVANDGYISGRIQT